MEFLTIVPWLILSRIGQDVVRASMRIAAASGVHHDKQGVASGMASTTLNVGNAIGLAVLIAVANGHAAEQAGAAHPAAVAEGIRLACCGRHRRQPSCRAGSGQRACHGEGNRTDG